MTAFAGFTHQPSDHSRLFIIAGPCVVETFDICRMVAERIVALRERYSIDILFKASYDKANRMSGSSFRGLGRDDGLAVLDRIKREFSLPIVTDIHEHAEAAVAAEVADVLQIPALLCRQTDLVAAAAATGKWVNIKKGQFMAPEDMAFIAKKAGSKVWLTERGSSFGYHRLVVDFTSIPIMQQSGCPVIFDATHSVQIPGGAGGSSSGNRQYALPLANAALAVGADGLFFEIHPDPDNALCDGPNSLSLDMFEKAVPKLIEQFERSRT